MLLEASENGKNPVLCDTGSCIAQFNPNSGLKIIDVVDFFSQNLDKLPVKQQEKTVMLHIPCGTKRLGLTDKMRKIAGACATQVVIPQGIECCGFAGDKGFSLPALNQSALKPLKKQIPMNCSEGYSAHPTCEIGLSRASGIPYQSIVHLLYEAVL